MILNNEFLIRICYKIYKITLNNKKQMKMIDFFYKKR